MEPVKKNCMLNTYPRPQRFQRTEGELRSVTEIPLIFRHIFNEYKSFNSVQSKVFDDVLYTNKPIILSAPTGSGKTVIFELAIIQILMQLEDIIYDNDFKIIYVAPLKALCSEKFLDWSKKFNPIGITCLEVTGDREIDLTELNSAKLLITTPEKWDSITRKWKDYEKIVTDVKLFMIDEVHLLNEDGRGPILEAIVSRMKTLQYSKKNIQKNEINLRFIAASATIPNIEDLGIWLGDKNAISHRISEDQRPVKLQKHVIGFSNGLIGFKFDMSLNYKLGGIIRKYSEGKPTLIFCSSRKSVEMASNVLNTDFTATLSDNHKASLIQLSKRLQDNKLKNLVLRGVAYHHAGLNYEDRNKIEDGFRKSLILVLVCTNTLAMGVNLPAHLVIIKSTDTFVCGSIIEYAESSILQMIGRAGRPQYDLNGVAVIMTQQKNIRKYQNLINGCTPIESKLHKYLAEHLNSEIVLQTITDLEIAMNWLRSTFLYIRACKCPINYGFPNDITKDKVEKKLEEMCLKQIEELEAHDLITKDQTYGLTIKSTFYGQLMARYYISFETMKIFRKIRGDETFLEIFNTIISCKEFSEFTLRVNDKKILNELNNKPIRFPIKGKIKTNENKISCLIQAILGTLPIQEPSLGQDSFRMIRLSERISKSLLEYIRVSANNIENKIYKALLHSTIITKCLKSKLWENSQYVCKQLNKIGAVYSNLLVNAGKTTFQLLLETDPRTLEMILNKAPPFGNEIHETIQSFPLYDLKLSLKGSIYAQIIVTQINEKYKTKGNNSTLIIGDTDNNLILYHDKIDNDIKTYGNYEKTFKIPNMETNLIAVHLIHDNLVGVDQSTTLVLNPIENDAESNKKRKPKVQSKLKVSKIAPKTKKVETVSKNLDVCNQFLEDDEYFENIDTLSLKSNPVNNISTSEIVETDDNKNDINSLKRKLKVFEYAERRKLRKCPNKNSTNESCKNINEEINTSINNIDKDTTIYISSSDSDGIEENFSSISKHSKVIDSTNLVDQCNFNDNILIDINNLETVTDMNFKETEPCEQQNKEKNISIIENCIPNQEKSLPRENNTIKILSIKSIYNTTTSGQNILNEINSKSNNSKQVEKQINCLYPNINTYEQFEDDTSLDISMLPLDLSKSKNTADHKEIEIKNNFQISNFHIPQKFNHPIDYNDKPLALVKPKINTENSEQKISLKIFDNIYNNISLMNMKASKTLGRKEPSNRFGPLKSNFINQPFKKPIIILPRNVDENKTSNYSDVQINHQINRTISKNTLELLNEQKTFVINMPPPLEKCDVLKEAQSNTYNDIHFKQKDVQIPVSKSIEEKVERVPQNLESSQEFHPKLPLNQFDDLYNIFSQFHKITGTQDIVYILESFCDNQLAPEAKICIIPEDIKSLADDLIEITHTEVLQENIKEFITENENDGKYICSDLIKGKSTVSNIIRLPDIKDDNFLIENKMFERYNENRLPQNNIYQPEVNKIEKLFDKITENPFDNTSIFKRKPTNPYRLNIPKRQKTFRIDKINFHNDEITRNLKLETLKQKYERNYDENSYFTEFSSTMFADIKKNVPNYQFNSINNNLNHQFNPTLLYTNLEKDIPSRNYSQMDEYLEDCCTYSQKQNVDDKISENNDNFSETLNTNSFLETFEDTSNLFDEFDSSISDKNITEELPANQYIISNNILENNVKEFSTEFSQNLNKDNIYSFNSKYNMDFKL